MDMSLGKLLETVKDREVWRKEQSRGYCNEFRPERVSGSGRRTGEEGTRGEGRAKPKSSVSR